MQRVDHPDPAAANAQALDDLENGATGLVLVFAGSVSANGFGLEPSAATLARVLDGVDFEAGVAVDLNLSPASRHIVRDFAALLKNRGIAPAAVDLRFSINPIGGFAAAGRSPRSWKELAPSFAAMVGELAGRWISRAVRRRRRARHSQCRRLGSAGARFCACQRGGLSARARSRRHGARESARRDLFPPVGGCRSVSDHGEISRRAKIVGARRDRLRA